MQSRPILVVQVLGAQRAASGEYPWLTADHDVGAATGRLPKAIARACSAYWKTTRKAMPTAARPASTKASHAVEPIVSRAVKPSTWRLRRGENNGRSGKMVSVSECSATSGAEGRAGA